MDLKPSSIEQTKFEYSPLGKIFNKGLDKDDKKEGLFKRLENIKDTNLTQLQAINDQGEKQFKKLKNIDESKTLKAIDEIRRKNDGANKLVSKFRKIDKTLDKAELVCTKIDGTKYDINRFALPLKFIGKIHNYEITLEEAVEDQTKLKILINKLNNDCNSWNLKKINEKNRVLESTRKLSDAREDIIGLFETKEEESGEESEEESKKERVKKFIKYVEKESKKISYDLFKKAL